MKPGMIAFLIIVLIIVIKDPKIINEIVNGLINIFNSGPTNG
jgi:hypothetical protein